MQVDVEDNPILVLKLNREEVRWLRATMQNPLHADSPEDEVDFDADMRRKFFEATGEIHCD